MTNNSPSSNEPIPLWNPSIITTGNGYGYTVTYNPVPPTPAELERINAALQAAGDNSKRTTSQIYDDAVLFIEALKWHKKIEKDGYTYTQGPLYLAGPMSGYDDHNFPLFNKVAEELRQQGWYVLNPAENFGGGADQTYEVHYLADIKLVEIATTVAFLPNWEKSSGAIGEYMLGDRLNKQLKELYIQPVHSDKLYVSLFDMKRDTITYIPFPRNQREETVLQEADRLVATDRQSQYGHPFDDFSRTADLWSAAGFQFYDEDTEVHRDIEPEEVAIAMMLLKISRIVNMPKRDSIVDTAGYAKTLDLVVKRRKELKG